MTLHLRGEGSVAGEDRNPMVPIRKAQYGTAGYSVRYHGDDSRKDCDLEEDQNTYLLPPCHPLLSNKKDPIFWWSPMVSIGTTLWFKTSMH